MVPFAYRTHTHSLGVRVSAWRERDGGWTLLGSGNPRKPQMFYLMGQTQHLIKTGACYPMTCYECTVLHKTIIQYHIPHES